MQKILLTLAALALAASAEAHSTSHHRSVSITVNTDDGEEVTRCDQIRVTFDGERAVMQEENIPAGSVRSLRAHAAVNGGVRVLGWDRSDWSITACKATAVGYDGRGVRAYLRGNELGVEGDDDDRQWVVYFLVRAPRNAVLDLDATNGPLSVHDLAGTVKVRTTNGPIALKGVGGSVDAEAQNGPITYAGNSGTVKLNAQNGPISVKLSGTTWSGGNLDARTQNGPISLKIPRDFRSGVVVESDGHGPIRCRAEACRDARRTFDDDDNRRIELGSGATLVRMSTSNGPVSVKEKED